MIIDMRKLVVRARANSSNLDITELAHLEAVSRCLEVPNYAPTWGQLDYLKTLVKKTGKKSKMGGFSGKTEQKTEKSSKTELK